MNSITNFTNEKNYNQARKKIAICNLSSYNKITIYGPKANDLINLYSIRNVEKIKDDSFYTILMKKRKFIEEVQVIRLSNLKYIIIYKENKKLLNILIKAKRKFPMVTVEDSTKSFSFFSFHGSKIYDYFKDNKSFYLYKVKHQNYLYYTLLTTIANKFSVLEHFRSIGFFEISLETRNLFLYNNNVITDLNKIKNKYRLNTYITIYDCDNYKFKSKIRILTIKQFEATSNNLIVDGARIYNSQKKYIGYVHNHFRLPNKKNPYVLAIVRKYLCEKVALIKHKKEETIIKDYQIY